MNIALVGYGRMGKAIEEIALKRGHTIVLKAEKTPTAEELKTADVAIEFTMPEAAVNNLKALIDNNVPAISGTTGWLAHYDELVAYAKQKNGAFLYASNFSLGVNLFFELNRQLSKLMQKYDLYDVVLEEIHHTKKLDAPSGTAITLAETVIENSSKEKWVLAPTSSQITDLEIVAKREGDVPGTHSVAYNSEIDSIEIIHTAHSRTGFALGAVLAAEWIADKKGVFSMKDVLGL